MTETAPRIIDAAIRAIAEDNAALHIACAISPREVERHLDDAVLGAWVRREADQTSPEDVLDRAIDALTTALARGETTAAMIGLEHGALVTTPVADMDELVDWENRRPAKQWWLGMRRMVRDLADPPTAAELAAQSASAAPAGTTSTNGS